jgi:hypothetical protein
MKNPQLFDLFKTRPAQSASGMRVPKYYAYAAPAEDSQPMVAGASTEPSGPSVINEDGSLSPAVDVGEVLGAGTEDLDFIASAIEVKPVADSEEGIQKYFIFSRQLETDFLDNAEFERALTSGSQAEIDRQTGKLEQIKNSLEDYSQVPESLARFHKLNIVQYRAAMNLLKNFLKADENPEMVTRTLGEFLQAQQEQQQELLQLSQKYNIYYAE